MKAAIQRLEIAPTYLCDTGGAATGWFPAWQKLTVDETLEGIVKVERIYGQVPRSSYYASQVIAGNVLRLRYSASSYDEYRIRQVKVVTNPGQPDMIEFTGTSPILDLAEQSHLLYVRTNGVVSYTVVPASNTPASLFTGYVVGFAPSYWSNGTITPTTVQGPTFAMSTPLAAAITIATQASLFDGVTYELSAERNGTSAYKLNLMITGASDPVAYLRSRRSLRAYEQTLDRELQITRANYVGVDGNGVGDNRFRVAAVVLNTSITISLIESGTGNPLVEDSAWNGKYIRDAAGNYHAITSSTRSTLVLGMAATAGIAVNDLVQLTETNTALEIAELDYPSAQTSYGVINRPVQHPSIPGVTNFFANPDCSRWTGASPGKPDDWVQLGGGATKETSIYRSGGVSAKSFDANNTFIKAVTKAATAYFPAGTYSFAVWVQVSQAGGTHRFTFAIGATFVVVTVAGVTPNVWTRLNGSFYYAGGSAQMSMIWDGTAATGCMCYVDGVFGCRASAVPVDYPYVGSGCADLMILAANLMRSQGAPVPSYVVSVRDWARLDSVLAPNTKFSFGATVDVQEEDTGAAFTARAVRILWDFEDLANTQVTLARRPILLTRS